jgi:hypothetical protein
MTHCLGLSSVLFNNFVGGNPTVTIGQYQYLNSTQIQREIYRQYDCTTAPGMPLEM